MLSSYSTPPLKTLVNALNYISNTRSHSNFDTELLCQTMWWKCKSRCIAIYFSVNFILFLTKFFMRNLLVYCTIYTYNLCHRNIEIKGNKHEHNVSNLTALNATFGTMVKFVEMSLSFSIIFTLILNVTGISSHHNATDLTDKLSWRFFSLTRNGSGYTYFKSNKPFHITSKKYESKYQWPQVHPENNFQRHIWYFYTGRFS